MFKKDKKKIFCIGTGKTGTTSIARALKDFKFQLGDQSSSELLLTKWYNRDFKSIIKFCHSADAFQDIPFSLPFTYIALDQYFKNAKFILTIRDTPNQWYESITSFHSKLWGEDQGLPNANQLKKASYRYLGFAYEAQKLIYNTPDEDLYNEETLKNFYTRHNHNVIEYFKSRPEKFLIINVSRKEDYFKLCKFLEKDPIASSFPWENKTDSL